MTTTVRSTLASFVSRSSTHWLRRKISSATDASSFCRSSPTPCVQMCVCVWGGGVCVCVGLVGVSRKREGRVRMNFEGTENKPIRKKTKKFYCVLTIMFQRIPESVFRLMMRFLRHCQWPAEKVKKGWKKVSIRVPASGSVILKRRQQFYFYLKKKNIDFLPLPAGSPPWQRPVPARVRSGRRWRSTTTWNETIHLSWKLKLWKCRDWTWTFSSATQRQHQTRKKYATARDHKTLLLCLLRATWFCRSPARRSASRMAAVTIPSVRTCCSVVVALVVTVWKGLKKTWDAQIMNVHFNRLLFCQLRDTSFSN